MKQLITLFTFLLSVNNLLGQSPGVSSFIDSVARKDNFNGTIIIANKSGTDYQKSYGLANFPFKVPNRIDTKYKIASITKLFTSVLIMQFFEQGKLDVSKHIIDYLPDYKGDAADKVTIHQLLNHTSGMANIDTVKSIESALKNGLPLYQKPHSTDDLLNNYCSDKLVNTPGKVFDYNNADYIVLGKIIEKICGKPYEQVVTERILQPLNMKSSGLVYQQNIITGLADTYFFREDLKKLVPDLPVYMENWYAAGAMYSTVSDLLLFSNALFGRKLLKQETLNKMFVSGLDEYGYGVWVYEDYKIKDKKFTIVKRPGQIMGAHSMLFHILEEGVTIIILSNTGNMSLDDFAARIARRVIR
jgi:CubicO group peptidase (beta-lactamase class C family)